MIFSYFPRPFISPRNKKNVEIFRPEIPIRLLYSHRLCQMPILALVDSGADNNLFPSRYALMLGINFRRGGEKRIITGIGNHQIEAYRFPITIYVDEFKINTSIDFCEAQQTPILGRRDFFRFFSKVIFKEESKKIELIPC